MRAVARGEMAAGDPAFAEAMYYCVGCRACETACPAGVEFGGTRADEGYFRLEAEAGRRQIVGGSLGKTTASFADGDPFVLEPEDRKSGWVGRIRGVGGNSGFHISGELGAEERESRVGISARASLVLGL